MTMKNDAKFEKEFTFCFKRGILQIFRDWKISDFTLGSKMAELNRNKNLKQLDRPDAVRKLILH